MSFVQDVLLKSENWRKSWKVDLRGVLQWHAPLFVNLALPQPTGSLTLFKVRSRCLFTQTEPVMSRFDIKLGCNLTLAHRQDERVANGVH